MRTGDIELLVAGDERNQNVVHASTVSKGSDGVNATYPSDSATPLVTSTALPA